MSPVIIWAILFAFFLFLEFLVPGDLLTIWFSFGALISCILAACNVNFTVRIICFLVVSGISMLLFRPLCLKLIKKNVEKQPLNTFIDTQIKLIDPIIDDNMGSAKIADTIYRCVSFDNSDIASGTICVVVEVRGNKLVVKPKS